MKSILILHGTGGSPNSNWFSWLASELKAHGLRVYLPALPHPDHPSLRANADFVHATCPFPLDSDTLIIGHSSGAILALILAQQNPTPIGAIIAVSAFHDNSLGWAANDRLFDVPFDWPAIRANASELLFIHSDTDPYVPLPQAQYVADQCQAELLMLPGQGHFNLEQSPDYTQFPKLLEILQQRKLI